MNHFPAQPHPPASASGSLPEIVIDLEKLRHINCGLGRFSLYLGQELHGLAKGHFEPIFFLPRQAEQLFTTGVNGAYRTIPVRPWRKDCFLRWLRPLGRRLPGVLRPALWHSTNQMSRYLPLDDRVPVVLTVHDLNFLHSGSAARDGRRRRRKLADIQRRIDRAAAIVTDSQYVADDLAKYVELAETPVYVVPLGLTPPPTASSQRPAWLPAGPFGLSVGNFLPHKNFQSLLGLAEQRPNLRLVIAGKHATPYGEQVTQAIQRRGLTNRIILPGIVSDADRQWLYEHCDVFLFPSLAEGFGFPVLEAMQCGKPVVMSQRTSLPEIAGSDGFFFDSYEPAAMAAVVDTALETFGTDPQAADRCRQHAARFSWRATAEGYSRVYAEVLAGLSTGSRPQPNHRK